MSATHGGKGDAPRPVDLEKYRANYDAIFRKIGTVRVELKDQDGKTVGWATYEEPIK